MDNAEILRSYNQAENKKKQIGILSELTGKSKDEIRAILITGGADLPNERRKIKEPYSVGKVLAEDPLTSLEKNIPVIPKLPAGVVIKIKVPDCIRQYITEEKIRITETMDRLEKELDEITKFERRIK